MADVDLLKDAYRNNLGREASDDEIQGWTSGSYGGGGVNDWVNQIANSGEAKARGGGQPAPVIGQPSPGENHAYNTPYEGPTQNAYDIPADFYSSLNNSYAMNLGRSASADEINNWWSGNYGYGQGASGLGAFTEAIRNSGEAKARNGGTAPSTQYQGVDYWGQQGVNVNDMFDTTTGQLKSGWQSTGRGYERTGQPAGSGGTGNINIQGPQNGNYQDWFTQLMNGKPPTPENLEAMAPTLAQYGIRLGSKGNRGWTDTIILPDGRTFDVIEAAGIGSGRAWTWQQNGGNGYTPPTQMPGDQYSDPYTKMLESLLKNRIGSLQQPVNDPNRQMYEQMLKQRADALGQGNSQLDQLMTYLQSRFKDLSGPGYTGAENEVIRTGALDPIEQDRAAAKKKVMDRLAQRNIQPGSGVYEAAMLEVDKSFDSMRGATQTQIAGNELARREDRAQRAQTIGTQLADIPDARAREQLDVFSALDRLSQIARSEDDARQREAISYGGGLNDLSSQRLQLAMQAAGMGGNPSSLGQTLTGIAGLNQNSAAYDANNNSSLWSGLGTLAAILARQQQAGLNV